MNTRVLIITVIAIGLGLAAGYTALRYLNNRPSVIQVPAGSETASVVLAAQDLPLGRVLEESDLRVVEWPAEALPIGFASTREELVGRSLVDDVSPNEPILASKLAELGLFGIIPLIEPGMRAMSISVDQVVGVAGFVTPQTKVDVILVMTPAGSSDPVSKIILQNVQALASGEEIRESEDGTPELVPVVTLLLTPEDSEKLALAESEGRIRLVLRNTLDVETPETQGQRASGLFTGVAGPARRITTTAAVPSARESAIEIYRGGVRTLIYY
jgi:pilus assembly protein CpaB